MENTFENSDKINFFIIIGGPNSRKSSIIRCLTGAGKVPKIYSIEKHKKYHIKITGNGLIEYHVETSALQEKPILPNEFIKTVKQILNDTGCYNFLFPLRIDGLKNDGIYYPDVQEYIDDFIKAGINIVQCELIGEPKIPSLLKYSGVNLVKCSVGPDNNKCNNEIASDIRNRWGWL